MIDTLSSLARGRALRIVEVGAWILGAALLTVFADAVLTERWRAPREADRFLVSVANAEPATTATFPAVSAPDQTLWSNTRRDAYRVSLSHSKPAPIAVLRIPTVRIEVPIYEGTSDAVLDRGAGWIKGTARVEDGGNIGIAAHRDSYFRALKDVRIGDAIELHTADEVRRFRIVHTQIVEPNDTSSLRLTDEDAITLVTCYPFYFVGHAPQRYIVRAIDANAGGINSQRNAGEGSPAGSTIETGDAP